MCALNPRIFRLHLTDFYPSITKLICCDQMDVRSALADLFAVQFTTLMDIRSDLADLLALCSSRRSGYEMDLTSALADLFAVQFATQLPHR
ncbi:hypothetical protein M569_11651 [Genlisea aurea]|uniref:Uncharacterized protein n=1 Tax=Genlisea aurea TaxID=192259 RepID=S8CF29_9LAMI|nr:hypothetical protein M569_11651 [Genlisea aurea]